MRSGLRDNGSSAGQSARLMPERLPAACRNMSYVETHRWLLLGHQLPTRSSNARVKTWRRLQQIGAIPARNSVYVLPNTDQCREDFEWIRTEILALGGEATVFAADAISDGGTEDIEAMFRRAREQEYRALKARIDRLRRVGNGKPQSAPRALKGRAVRTLRERFAAIQRVDFFTAPGGVDTAEAMALLEQGAHGRHAARSAAALLRPAEFAGRRWVTRPRPGVDRMASAWLIRRFIDADSTFAFTDQPNHGDIPFDMYSGEFSHHGDSCTFEVLVERFGLQRAAITRIAAIVHDLDMKDPKFGSPDAVAVGRIVEGLRALHADDATLLEQGIAIFDALAQSFQSDEGTRGAARTAHRVTRARRRQ